MEWIIFWIACGAGAGAIAASKGREALGWFLGGLLMGPLALVIVGFMTAKPEQNAQKDAASEKKTRPCPFCAEEILAEAQLCKHCKSQVEPLPMETKGEEKHKTPQCPMCLDRGCGVTACPNCGKRSSE